MSKCSFVEGAPASVVDLIKVRQEKFGKPNKTDEELSVIHGNCPWVVLRSGVDAPAINEDRYRVYPRTIEQPVVTNDWAKKTVLGGELQDRSGTGTIRPAGIQTLPDDAANKFSSAYRITQYQGHRPVSGITEFTVKSKDTWGMILEADIKIKCWSVAELDMLDRVYFKPGYAALLEWGHTVYFREDGSICKTPQLMISDKEFFEVIKGDYLELDQKILEKRKQNPNQEAVFGYITNFSFSLNKDGSYDCSLKLLSKGSVLPGLKVKSSDGEFTDPEERERNQDDDKVAWESRSIWHRIYAAIENAGNKNLIGELPETISKQETSLRQLPPRAEIKTSELCFDGKNAIEQSELFDTSELGDLKYGFPVLELPIKIVPWWTVGFAQHSCGYYITLRSLLYLVNIFNSEGKIQFNLWDEATYVDAPTVEELTYKYEDGTERTSIPAVSFNPYVAVKPKQGGTEYDPFGKVSDKAAWWTYVVGLPLWSLTAFKKDKAEIRDNQVTGKGKYDQNTRFRDVVGYREGNAPQILDIWINFGQFVNEIDHQIENKVQDYFIMEAIEGLLGRIQKAFGNVNEFKIVADHRIGDTYFSIIDTKCIDTADKEGRNPPTIQVTGLENTVSNLTIQSEISSDLANQMSIAAQAPRTYEEGAENADESMIHWGENCQQRWVVPDKTKVLTDEELSKEAEKKEEKKKKYEKQKRRWVRRLKKYYNKIDNSIIAGGTGNKGRNQEKVEDKAQRHFESLQLDSEKYIHDEIGKTLERAKDPNLQMGIIPIRAGLTMMGIGNFTIGNTFKMKSGVLLQKYQDWAHIVTGIEHKVSKARWETTLKTQYYPVWDDSKVVRTNSTLIDQGAVVENIMSGTSTAYAAAPATPLENEELASTMYEQTGAHSSRGYISVGDQTGTEVSSKNYKVSSISQNWVTVYRCTDRAVALRAAEIARKLAASNAVGYSQGLDTKGTKHEEMSGGTTGRNSLYMDLVLNYGGNVDAYIASGRLTNADCASFCHTCYAAADSRYKVDGRNLAACRWNWNETFSFGRGWMIYSAQSIKSKDQLQIGDILWRPSHVEMVTKL